MKNEIIAGVIGAAVGFGAGYYICFKLKEHAFEDELAQELEENDKYWKKRMAKAEKKAKAASDWEKIKEETKKSAEGNSEETKSYIADKGDISKYHKVVAESGYIPANAPLMTGSEDQLEEDDICVIPPENFEAIDEYDTETLIYYEKDDLLTDELDNEIGDREDVTGDEFVNYFGVYEDNTVYVVNHPRKCYYKIVLDE